MDTYLMKNDEHMQVERAQPQYKLDQYTPTQFQQPQYPQPQYQLNQYPSQQHYPQPRGVEIFEEEELVEEEAKSYAITVENQDTLLNIVQVLRRNVCTVRNFTIL